MRTRRNRARVSPASELSRLGIAAVLAVPLWTGACAGRYRAVTAAQRTESTDTMATAATATTPESPPDLLQFDNQATVYVDVYLVGGQRQWRLGRVSPGVRAMLKVPASAIDSTVEYVRVAVIPGSQMSAEASRDPRAIIAIAQPMSETLSQRWTFRPAASPALQLQATRLPGRP